MLDNVEIREGQNKALTDALTKADALVRAAGYKLVFVASMKVEDGKNVELACTWSRTLRDHAASHLCEFTKQLQDAVVLGASQPMEGPCPTNKLSGVN
jgi:uncharacterized protein YggE